jgi:hypothetical protein
MRFLNGTLPEARNRAAQFRNDSSHYLNHHSNLLRIIAVMAGGEKPAGQAKASVKKPQSDRGTCDGSV